MSDTPEIDLRAAKRRLLARQRELLRLVEASVEARRPVELDQTRIGRLSRMDALQSQAMSVETDRRRRVELRRIDAALGRIAAGDYGFCVGCGETIALKRLDLDPATPVCIDCAEDAAR
jgi:DnaK suppressor protein